MGTQRAVEAAVEAYFRAPRRVTSSPGILVKLSDFAVWSALPAADWSL